MKSAIKRLFSPLNLVILIWHVVLWFVPAYIVSEMGDFKHNPFTYIFIFFIINTFGVGAVISFTHKEALDELYPFVHDMDMESDKKMKIKDKLSRVLKS